MLVLRKCGSAKDQLWSEAVSENAARAGETQVAGRSRSSVQCQRWSSMMLPSGSVM